MPDTRRLSPVREGELRAFALASAPDFVPVFEELVALRTELAEVRWRAAETERVSDALAARVRELTSYPQCVAPRQGETP